MDEKMNHDDQTAQKIEQTEVGFRLTVKSTSPTKHPDVVDYLYNVERMSGPEIADVFGVTKSAIYKVMNKFGIERRSTTEANNIWTLRTPPSFGTDRDGYERVQTKYKGDKWSFAIHRLIAVSEYGFEGVSGKVIHHKNGIPWDNRPSNLVPMKQSTHVREHFETIPINHKLAMLEWSRNTTMTHAEIASVLGYSRSTVNSIVARAKRCN